MTITYDVYDTSDKNSEKPIAKLTFTNKYASRGSALLINNKLYVSVGCASALDMSENKIFVKPIEMDSELREKLFLENSEQIKGEERAPVLSCPYCGKIIKNPHLDSDSSYACQNCHSIFAYKKHTIEYFDTTPVKRVKIL